MVEQYHRIKEKLLEYRLNRSHSRLKIKLCISQKKFRISFCFPTEDWLSTAVEKEYIEDLLENELSVNGWYLKPRYKLIPVDRSCFKHDCLTIFTVKHW